MLRLRLFLLILTFVFGAPLAAGFFNALHPAFDSLTHFRFHLAALLAAVGMALLAVRLWLNGAASIVFAAAAAWVTYVPAGFVSLSVEDAQAAAGRPTYRLLQLNLLYRNQTPEAVLSLIARLRPDVVTLQEVSPMWSEKLALIESAYPYRVVCPAPFFSAAILSRRPFSDARPPSCHVRGALAIAGVDFAGQTVDIASLHLKWPWPARQAEQIGQMAGPLNTIGETAILGGDFNATPWSVTVRRVFTLSGMTRMERVGPTWLQRHLPSALTPLGLPIDQIMSKGAVTVKTARRLDPVGSDHLPVLLEFSLQPPEPEPAVQTVDAGRAILSAAP